VLDNACKQASTWSAEFDNASPQVYVNVSARQSERPGFVENVSRSLQTSGLAPFALSLELTEEGLGLEPELALRRVNRLAELGVSIVIDDFGRGFSSLALLECLPIAGLKVGRDFVEGLGRDPDHVGVLRAAIAVARALSLTVTAEGLERQEQRMVLAALGCHYGQGYLFAPPLDPGTIERVLQRTRSTAGAEATQLQRRDLPEHPARCPGAARKRSCAASRAWRASARDRGHGRRSCGAASRPGSPMARGRRGVRGRGWCRRGSGPAGA